MTIEKLKKQLVALGFYTGNSTGKEQYIHRCYKGRSMNVEVDQYTIRITWWPLIGHSVSKSYYIERDIDDYCSVEEFLEDFVEEMCRIYGIE